MKYLWPCCNGYIQLHDSNSLQRRLGNVAQLWIKAVEEQGEMISHKGNSFSLTFISLHCPT